MADGPMSADERISDDLAPVEVPFEDDPGRVGRFRSYVAAGFSSARFPEDDPLDYP